MNKEEYTIRELNKVLDEAKRKWEERMKMVFPIDSLRECTHGTREIDGVRGSYLVKILDIKEERGILVENYRTGKRKWIWWGSLI